MRRRSHFQRAITYSKLGLMVLREHFEQRPVEATYGSFRSLIPLRTPSGPQWTESELETELLQQLAFAPFVYDLLTQPIIHYELDGKRRRYTPDIVMQMHGTGDDLPTRYIIEVKRREDLARDPDYHALRFEVGRLCAEHIGGTFRVMDETRIKTPYLQNARLLSGYLAIDLNDEEMRGLAILHRHAPIVVGRAIELLAEHGFAEPDARHIIEHAAAHRDLDADLGKPFTDDTTLRPHPDGIHAASRKDTILGLLQDAPDR